MRPHLAFIDGHVDAVKACVRSWKHFDVFVAVDGELSDVSIIALKKSKVK